MKRIILIAALLASALQGYAQDLFHGYDTYTLNTKENHLADILNCESDMGLIIGYVNMQWVDPVGSPGGQPMFTLHGLKYEGNYVMPIWGPLGLDITYLGLNFAVGKMPTGETPMHMSWNFALMPMLTTQFGKFRLNAFAGVKPYISFLLDGTDSYPITTLSDNVDSWGRGLWLNSAIGVDLVHNNKTGLRITYENGLSGRLKDKYYEDTGMSRSSYDPRYSMLSVCLVFWMM